MTKYYALEVSNAIAPEGYFSTRVRFPVADLDILGPFAKSQRSADRLALKEISDRILRQAKRNAAVTRGHIHKLQAQLKQDNDEAERQVYFLASVLHNRR